MSAVADILDFREVLLNYPLKNNRRAGRCTGNTGGEDPEYAVTEYIFGEKIPVPEVGNSGCIDRTEQGSAWSEYR